MGDRTKEALETFADSLVPSAGQPHLRHGQLKAAPRTPGCNVAGTATQAQQLVACTGKAADSWVGECSTPYPCVLQHPICLRQPCDF
jgi:hypothetical protein